MSNYILDTESQNSFLSIDTFNTRFDNHLGFVAKSIEQEPRRLMLDE